MKLFNCNVWGFQFYKTSLYVSIMFGLQQLPFLLAYWRNVFLIISLMCIAFGKRLLILLKSVVVNLPFFISRPPEGILFPLRYYIILRYFPFLVFKFLTYYVLVSASYFVFLKFIYIFFFC